MEKNTLFVSAIGFVSLFKFELLMTTRIRKKTFFINYMSNYILLLPGAELLQDRNSVFCELTTGISPSATLGGAAKLR